MHTIFCVSCIFCVLARYGIFWLGMGLNGPKMSIFHQKPKFGRLWANIPGPHCFLFGHWIKRAKKADFLGGGGAKNPFFGGREY